ncbi:MAG: alanine dehydrogenase [Firmicutes bacterium]|nr:alanine dehydrogenase [Bacillota bacterium]
MIISLPKEIKDGEYRVAIIPSNVARLVDAGHTVYVQKDAGAAAGYPDSQYIEAGAIMVDTEKECFEKGEMVVKVKEILPSEFGLLREDQILFTYIHSSTRRAMTEEILGSKCIGIAYEDMMDERGHFILLEPMSRIAGEIGFLYGLFYSQTVFGGLGKSINGSIGVKPMKVVIFGGGNVGVAAARLALGLNADVVIMDVDLLKLEDILANKLPNVRTCFSNKANITKEIKDADLVLNCIKWIPGLTLISRDMLDLMQSNAMIVDIDAEPGGGIESSRFTTHEDPVFVERGIRHIGIPNLPSAVSNTASAALSNASIKYVMELADKGWKKACQEDKCLEYGLDFVKGHLTFKTTAEALGMELTSKEWCYENL